ncbi:succinate dehydrogenase, cytochrome b556 subunit [Thermodesulfobacteriota bacterium]
MMYRWHTGGIAWLLHRLSGIALAFYLVLHIWVIHSLSLGSERFDQTMDFLGSPVFKLLEIGLLGTIVYHALNGIRVLIIDFGNGAQYHKQLFWILVVGLGGLLTIAGAIPILLGFFA